MNNNEKSLKKSFRYLCLFLYVFISNCGKSFLDGLQYKILLFVLFLIFIAAMIFPIYIFTSYSGKIPSFIAQPVETAATIPKDKSDANKANGINVSITVGEQNLSTTEGKKFRQTVNPYVVCGGLFVCIVYLVGYIVLIFFIVAVFRSYKRNRLLKQDVEPFQKVLSANPSFTKNEYLCKTIDKFLSVYLDRGEK